MRWQAGCQPTADAGVKASGHGFGWRRSPCARRARTHRAEVEEDVGDEEEIDEDVERCEGDGRAVHQVCHAVGQRHRDEDDEDHRRRIPEEAQARGGQDHERVVRPNPFEALLVTEVALGLLDVLQPLVLDVRLRPPEDLVVRILLKELFLLFRLLHILLLDLLLMPLGDRLAQLGHFVAIELQRAGAVGTMHVRPACE